MANPVLSEIIRQGRHQPRGKRRRYTLAAIETGIVESGLRNLPGGDADSAGWRQERASLYPDPTNVRHSVHRFYREVRQHDRGQRAGELAADVQRPAAQYRGRYAGAHDRAAELLRQYFGAFHDAGDQTPSQPGGGRQTVEIGRRTTTDQDAFEKARAGAILGQLIARRHGTDSPLFKTGLLSTTMPSPADFQTTQLTSKTITHGKPPTAGGGASSPDTGGSVRDMLDRAIAQSKLKRPYQWGGGHGAKPASIGTPVDCSGYTSMILGVSPRVSGQYAASYGKPGPGKQVTIYANSGHVLMSIRDPRSGKWRWFATSHSNPGGGAGEIPTPSRAYLSAFTARHPKGL